MAEKIHSTNDITKYLTEYKKICASIVNGNKTLIIKIKPPNLSEEITESLACKLINNGTILSDKYGENARAERFGKSGCDIVVNDLYKIECKGTTSLDGFVSVTKTNLFERDAWIWLDFQPFIHKNSSIVEIHIIHKPNECIKPRKIEANGESKITMRTAIKDAIEVHSYQFYELSTHTMGIKANTGPHKLII